MKKSRPHIFTADINMPSLTSFIASGLLTVRSKMMSSRPSDTKAISSTITVRGSSTGQLSSSSLLCKMCIYQGVDFHSAKGEFLRSFLNISRQISGWNFQRSGFQLLYLTSIFGILIRIMRVLSIRYFSCLFSFLLLWPNQRKITTNTWINGKNPFQFYYLKKATLSFLLNSLVPLNFKLNSFFSRKNSLSLLLTLAT